MTRWHLESRFLNISSKWLFSSSSFCSVFSARLLGWPMLRPICKAKNPKFQLGLTLFQGCATATEWTATATLDWVAFCCWVENKTFPTVQSKGDPVPVKVVSLAYIVICYLLLDVYWTIFCAVHFAFQTKRQNLFCADMDGIGKQTMWQFY